MRNRGKIYFMLQSIILLLYLKKHQTFATKKKRQTSMGAKRVPCGPQHTSVPGSGTREQDGHDSHPSAAKPGSPEWESGPEAASPTWELARDTHLDPPQTTWVRKPVARPSKLFTGAPGGSDAAKV